MTASRMGRNPFEKKRPSQSGSGSGAGAGPAAPLRAAAQQPARESVDPRAAEAPTGASAREVATESGTVSRLARWALVEVPAEGFVLGLKAALLLRARMKGGRAD